MSLSVLLIASVVICVVLGIMIYKVIALPAENITPELTIFLLVYALQFLLIVVLGEIEDSPLEIFEYWSFWAPFFYILFALVMHELGIIFYGKPDRTQIAFVVKKRKMFFLLLILLMIILGRFTPVGIYFIALISMLSFPLLIAFFVYSIWVRVRSRAIPTGEVVS